LERVGEPYLQTDWKLTGDIGDSSQAYDRELARHSCNNPPTDTTDPVKDPLDWLDDDLPDLSGFENRFFDLATQSDIARYVDVLADSVSDKQKVKILTGQRKVQKNAEASSLVPKGRRGPDKQL